MRRLLLFFMLFPVAVCAQEDYKPLLKDGKTWKHAFTNIYYEHSASLTVQGDTLIMPASDKQTDSGTFDLHGHRWPNSQALPSRHGAFIRDGKKILR